MAGMHLTVLPLLAALALVSGCDGEPAAPPPPPDMVTLSTADGWAFAIDIYEFPNEAGVKPRTYVNMDEAQAACQEAGKRLCTAQEWRRACEGPEGAWRYGYGADFSKGACFAGQALPSGHTSMMDPTELVAAAGAYERCVTPEGVHDLVGNLEEWVFDDWKGVDGMLEGGAWYTYPRYADCSGRYSRQPDYRIDPRKRVYSAGFRCCTSPEPLDQARIAADAARRLAASRERASTRAYDPGAEVQVSGGLWIDRYEYPNHPGEHPLAGVSQERAQALCEQADKRLCSAYEWELACAGPEHAAFPYGDDFVPNACAAEIPAPAPSGRYLACSSFAGAQDMVGGVWEWTGTPLDVPGLKARPDQVLRELRGGSWYTDPGKARCQPRDGYPAAPQDAAFPDVGFRCCRGTLDLPPDEPQAGSVRCQEGLVAIGDFCIDRFEHPGVEGQRPVANLDFAGATLACEERGLRLCSEAEWEQACAGPHHRRWPYGNVYEPDRCHDESRIRETNAGEASAAGAYPSCATPEGLMDMSGNLWEWVATPRSTGAIKGGGWNVSAGLGQCTARAFASTDYASAETGTRCCSDGVGR